MKKWLFLLLVIAILYAVSKISDKRRPQKSPLRKRVDETITILVWALLAAYGIAFLYWLYTEIFR